MKEGIRKKELHIEPKAHNSKRNRRHRLSSKIGQAWHKDGAEEEWKEMENIPSYQGNSAKPERYICLLWDICALILGSKLECLLPPGSHDLGGLRST